MLYIEKIIEWGKKKGYDDFYLTKVVSNIVTDYIPLGAFMALFFSVSLVVFGFPILLYTFIGISEAKWLILILFQFFILFIPGILFILPLIILGFSATSGNMTLKNQEKKGIREDIREAAFWKNSMAKFAIRVIRNVPKHCNWLFRISVIIPIITIIISIVIFSSSECGWGVMAFLLAYLVLYFLIIRFVLKKLIPLYKKYLARVEKEGWYFVNWKVDQDIEHYDEWVSGHEEWWTDEALLNFDKFIKDKHRIFPFSSFVFTYTWLFVWLMWTLSVSIGATPLGAFYCYKMMFEETKTEKVAESVDDNFMSNEEDIDNSIEEVDTNEDEGKEEIEQEENINEELSIEESIPENDVNIFDFVCTRIVTEEDLRTCSKKDLRIMRNWIYARHGYKFKSQDLQEYFSQFDWYSPRYTDVTSQLSEIELKNVDFISRHE